MWCMQSPPGTMLRWSRWRTRASPAVVGLLPKVLRDLPSLHAVVRAPPGPPPAPATRTLPSLHAVRILLRFAAMLYAIEDNSDHLGRVVIKEMKDTTIDDIRKSTYYCFCLVFKLCAFVLAMLMHTLRSTYSLRGS